MGPQPGGGLIGGCYCCNTTIIISSKSTCFRGMSASLECVPTNVGKYDLAVVELNNLVNIRRD